MSAILTVVPQPQQVNGGFHYLVACLVMADLNSVQPGNVGNGLTCPLQLHQRWLRNRGVGAKAVSPSLDSLVVYHVAGVYISQGLAGQATAFFFLVNLSRKSLLDVSCDGSVFEAVAMMGLLLINWWYKVDALSAFSNSRLRCHPAQSNGIFAGLACTDLITISLKLIGLPLRRFSGG